jgi:hypothetical protein
MGAFASIPQWCDYLGKLPPDFLAVFRAPKGLELVTSIERISESEVRGLFMPLVLENPPTKVGAQFLCHQLRVNPIFVLSSTG